MDSPENANAFGDPASRRRQHLDEVGGLRAVAAGNVQRDLAGVKNEVMIRVGTRGMVI